MALSSTGSQENQNLFFNTGVITVDSSRVIEVVDVSVDMTFSEKSFYANGSIKKRAINRAEFNAELSFTVHNFSPVLWQYFFSSSSASGSDVVYNVNDGPQNRVTTWLATFYLDGNEAGAKGLQYTITNPTILNLPLSNGSQEFAQFEVTVACTDISIRKTTLN
jgi:hypothetical protein